MKTKLLIVTFLTLCLAKVKGQNSQYSNEGSLEIYSGFKDWRLSQIVKPQYNNNPAVPVFKTSTAHEENGSRIVNNTQVFKKTQSPVQGPTVGATLRLPKKRGAKVHWLIDYNYCSMTHTYEYTFKSNLDYYNLPDLKYQKSLQGNTEVKIQKTNFQFHRAMIGCENSTVTRNPKLSFYYGARAGILIIKERSDTEVAQIFNPDVDHPEVKSRNTVAFRLNMGLLYAFDETISLKTELGMGGGNSIQTGVQFNF